MKKTNPPKSSQGVQQGKPPSKKGSKLEDMELDASGDIKGGAQLDNI